ncbi:MAG: hypothetical protein FWC89_00885 [Defluviitaleaceae bacterium]|nr:hypothetical protein [Defluviitaleaceae bacterium]
MQAYTILDAFVSCRTGLLKDAAKLVCEQYIPLVLESLKNRSDIYTPNGDENLLNWTIISFACLNKLSFKPDTFYTSRLRVKRKDGGDYIAGAVLSRANEVGELSYNLSKYTASSNMTRWGDSPEDVVSSWQLKSYFDNRTANYNENRYEDYVNLYNYMDGKLTKSPANADHFKRLYDKNYLVPENNTDYINMVITSNQEGEFKETLPAPPPSLEKMSDELDQKLYDLEKQNFPAHLQDILRSWHTNSLAAQDFVTYVLARLQEDKMLSPLTEVQKASVNTIMFCDKLPKY